MFGRVLPPLNGELKFLGEFGGSLVGSRGFGSRGFDRGSDFGSISGLSSNSKCSLFANFGSNI
jgi:hypothetical protein